MARINVYVPDDLAARSRKAGLNVSAPTRQALAAALAGRQTDDWLETLPRTPLDRVADAFYVELAHQLGTRVLTIDARLARASTYAVRPAGRAAP